MSNFLSDWIDLSLDDKTANKMLWITESGSKVSRMTDNITCPVLETQERYEYVPQVRFFFTILTYLDVVVHIISNVQLFLSSHTLRFFAKKVFWASELTGKYNIQAGSLSESLMKGQGEGEATDPAGWEKMRSPGVLGGVDPITKCGLMVLTLKSGIFPSTPPLGCTLTIQLVSSIFMQLNKRRRNKGENI